MKNKELLIICATHGNEEFSIPVVERLSKKYSFDFIIGNPNALKKCVRYCDTDLNRSAPGKPESINYEEVRAFEIMEIASKYNTIIDIHGTKSASAGLFLILSDPNWRNIELSKKINLKNVVLWPSLKDTGPLTQFIPNSLEIECGHKNTPEVAEKLYKVLDEYLQGKVKQMDKNYYIVTGKVKGKFTKPMYDFRLYKVDGEYFYPLMPGQYAGINCYKMQKLSDTL